MKKILFISTVFLLMITSCLKDNLIVPAPEMHSLKIELSAEQPAAFVDLKGKELYLDHQDDWHLKFQNEDNNWAIFLNPLKDVSIHRTIFTELELVGPEYIVLNGPSWQKDVPLDKTILPAIGTWGDYSFEFPQSFNRVYLIRIKENTSLKYRKFQILGATKERYTLEMSDLDGSNSALVLVPKNEAFVHSYLALDSVPLLVNVEPMKSNWQINFTFGLDSILKNLHQADISVQSDSLGIYQIFGVNKPEVELAYVNEAYADIDYFFAKELDFERCEIMSNHLVRYDQGENRYFPSSHNLVCRLGDEYFKLKIESVHFERPQDFSFDLRIQNL